MPPRHVDDRPNRYTRRLHIRQEHCDAPVLRGLWVRPSQQQYPVRVVGLRRPDFLPVNHPLVAVHHGPCPEGRQVRPRLRLRVALAPDNFSAGDAAKVSFLLLLRAVDHDCRAYVAYALAVAARCISVGPFVGEDGLLHMRRTCAAVLLGPGERQPALVGQLFTHVHFRCMGLFAALYRKGIVRPLLGQKVLDLLPKALLFCGEFVFHGYPLRPSTL